MLGTLLLLLLVCGSSTQFTGYCPNNGNVQILNNVVKTCNGPTDTFSCQRPYSCQYGGATVRAWYCCSSGSTSGFCPVGYTVQNIPNTVTPQNCQPNQPVCQSGGTCQYSTQLRAYYCCIRSGSSGYCPSGTTPYYLNNAPRTCTAGITGACPTGYTCQFSQTLGRSYCCQGGGSNACPSNYSPFLINNVPQQCSNIVGQNQCQTGYQCLRSTTSNLFYCCKFGTTTNNCPIGYTAVIGPTGQSQPCSSTTQYCQTGVCLMNTQGQYYCCTRGSASTIRCPNNQPPYSVGGVPRTCQPNNAFNTCPNPYTCVLASTGLSSGYYCCQGTSNICPSGQQAYPSNTNPQTCILGSFNTCPSPSTCQRSQMNTGLSYCCGGTSSNYCPVGYTPYQFNGQPQSCQLGGINNCVSPYTCMQRAVGQPAYCCSRTGTSNICPSGQQAYPSNTNPQTCILGRFNTCPSPTYTCQRSPMNTAISYCCGGTSSNYCPAGYTPYQFNGQPQSCQLGGINNCVSPYTCMQRAVGQPAYCCSRTGTSNICPSGQQAYPSNTNPQTCILGRFNTCPSPTYTCQRSLTNAALAYCCGTGTSGFCPAGQQAYPSNTNPQTCSQGFNTCPSPYTCQRSSTNPNLSYCCGTGTNYCPTNYSPYQFNGQPQSCQLGGINNCVSPYTCMQRAFGQPAYCCRFGSLRLFDSGEERTAHPRATTPSD